MTKKLKKSKGKVEKWDRRHTNPYLVYQLLIGKVVSGYDFDDEEREFFHKVEAMLKSGELTVAKPSDDDYEKLVTEELRREYPNEYVVFYKFGNIPTWANNYFTQLKDWLNAEEGRSEEEFQSLHKVSFKAAEVEHSDGYVFRFASEKQSTFLALKFS